MTQVRAAAALSAAGQLPEPNAVGLTRYVWITVAIVAVVEGGGLALQRSFVPSATRSLRHRLSELPLAIGPWTAKAPQHDRTTFAEVGADEQHERLYVNRAGDAVCVYQAAWVWQDDWAPHLPEVCYTTNGWELSQTRSTLLPVRHEVWIVVQNYQKLGERVVVVYWYQLDDQSYCDREGGRKVARAQWGRQARLPLLKTLLQTDDSDGAEQRLLEIAASIYKFNCEL